MKLSWFVDATTSREYPVFEVLILADVFGLKYLARFFADQAKNASRKGMRKCLEDDDDHQHLLFLAPMNKRLSDQMDIRLGTLTTRNRKTILNKYGINNARRRVGSMVPHLRLLAKQAETYVRIERRRPLSKKDIATLQAVSAWNGISGSASSVQWPTR